jgi:hypothetical protein
MQARDARRASQAAQLPEKRDKIPWTTRTLFDVPRRVPRLPKARQKAMVFELPKTAS